MSISDSTSKDPGLFEVTIGVLLSVTLGALLAAVSMTVRPVAKVREMPKEPAVGTVYYLQGAEDSVAARQWTRKSQSFLAKQPGETVFIEEELNGWARSAFTPGSKDKKSQDDSMLPRLEPGVPNFRIHDGELQIGIECGFHVYGMNKPVIVQMSGDLEKSGDHYAYVAKDVWVGGLHASSIPAAGAFVADRLLGSFQLTDEMVAAWKALADAKLEGRQLILRLP